MYREATQTDKHTLINNHLLESEGTYVYLERELPRQQYAVVALVELAASRW